MTPTPTPFLSLPLLLNLTTPQSHLVLSGGLGNSAYVRDSLSMRYAQGRSAHPSAQNLQIRVAPEPQLVVCKGNVADRVQKIKSGQGVLGWRCSRSSYGTLCKVVYDAANPGHMGAPTQVDALDGKTYVMQHVDWFVKQVCVVFDLVRLRMC